ncbi:MAG: PilZ domain-containing protein [Deltaproteobacteria bacterium]|nr:PilZ domain-containing protein [Deltaproteobacteria bacterium]
MDEKRKYPRKKVGAPVLYKGGKKALERARLRDISRNGLFIETASPPKPGEFVILNLDGRDIGKELNIKAKVVRSILGDGMGLTITTTTDDRFLRDWLSS